MQAAENSVVERETMVAPNPAAHVLSPGLEVLPADVSRGAKPDMAPLRLRVIDRLTSEPIRLFRTFCLRARRPARRPGEGRADVRDYAARYPTRGHVTRHLSGLLEYRGLATGTYELLFRAAGHEDLVLESVDVPSRDELLVALGRGAHVAGQVQDPRGSPLARTPVFLECRQTQGDLPRPRCRARHTDAAGRFVFSPLPPGVYAVSVAGQKTSYFTLHEGERHEESFCLAADNVVRVTVRNTEARPLADASVRLERRGLTRGVATDMAGLGEIRCVKAGRYALTVSCRGFDPWRRFITIEESALNEFVVDLAAASRRALR